MKIIRAIQEVLRCKKVVIFQVNKIKKYFLKKHVYAWREKEVEEMKTYKTRFLIHRIEGLVLERTKYTFSSKGESRCGCG